MIKLTPEEINIAEIIQKDIPVTSRPFRLVGERTGLDETSVLGIIAGLRDRGIIRKVGAILRHQPAGFVRNALILWAVPAGRTDEVGQILASFPEVTHCYERQPPFAERYSIFSMIHMKEHHGNDLIEALIRATGITDIQILTSVEEFKKSSMEYFDET